jgi:hypothetical protein
VNDARLQVPPGYDPKSAGTARIAWLAAQLDDQLRLLATRLAGASVELLEWQLQPGVNTIGMLLAHNAVGEAYWVHIAAGRVHDRVEADRAVTATLGIGLAGDGMPIPPGGGHPARSPCCGRCTASGRPWLENMPLCASIHVLLPGP